MIYWIMLSLFVKCILYDSVECKEKLTCVAETTRVASDAITAVASRR